MAGDEEKRKITTLQGGLQSQSGTSSQNAAQALEFPPLPHEWILDNLVQPSLVSGIKSTSATTNTVMAISALTDAAGNNKLVVDTLGSGLTMSSPTFNSVGVASAEAVPVNTSRRYLIMVNTSGATISLAFGAAAVLNSGITLAPGAAYEMIGGNLCTAQIRAIASAAASNLAFQEGV